MDVWVFLFAVERSANVRMDVVERKDFVHGIALV
jgi:hypothetical protein